MPPSKFAIKGNPYTGRLSERETAMVAAVLQVALAQMGTPKAEHVVNYKNFGSLVGISNANNAKRSLMNFFDKFHANMVLNQNKSKLLWAFAKVANGPPNVDYDKVAEICKIMWGKNARQSSKTLFDKIAKGKASTLIILTPFLNPRTNYRNSGVDATQSFDDANQEEVEEEHEDGDNADDDHDAEEDELFEPAYDTRNSSRQPSKKAARKPIVPKHKSTGGKTVFDGQIVRTEEEHLETGTLPDAYTEHDKQMADIADQHHVTDETYDETERSPELSRVSNIDEVEPSNNCEIQAYFEKNGEVGNNVTTENPTQALGPQQANYSLLRSIVQQAMENQQTATFDQVQDEQSAQPVAGPLAVAYQMDASQSVLPTLWMWVMNKQAQAQVTQADMDAAHEHRMSIEDYMDWRVYNGFTPALWPYEPVS